LVRPKVTIPEQIIAMVSFFEIIEKQLDAKIQRIIKKMKLTK